MKHLVIIFLLIAPFASSVSAKTVALYDRWSIEVPDDWVSTTSFGEFLAIHHVGPNAEEIANIRPRVFAASAAKSKMDCPKIRLGLSFGKASSYCKPAVVAGENEPTESSIKVGQQWLQGFRTSETVGSGEVISYTFILDIRAFPGSRSEYPVSVLIVATGKTEEEIEAYLAIFAKIKKLGVSSDDSSGEIDMAKVSAALYQQRPEFGYVYHAMSRPQLNAFVSDQEKRIAVFSLHGIIGGKYRLGIIYKAQLKSDGPEIEKFIDESLGVTLLSDIEKMSSGTAISPRALTREDVDKISLEGVAYLDKIWDRLAKGQKSE